ncbi:MAG: hypothetical protein KDC34_20760 [Saprospiraceae bacterium]|nr:hypothetical protein [Saprospiraceae bacterium]
MKLKIAFIILLFPLCNSSILFAFSANFLADTVPPIAICDTMSTVTLNNMGMAFLAANYFDAGSSDETCLNNIEVRRFDTTCLGTNDTVFVDSIHFCCSDIINSPIQLELLVYDCSGNFDKCLFEVTVEDDFPPFIVTCPAPQTIDCGTFTSQYLDSLENENFEVLDDFGSVFFYDECSFTTSLEVTIILDECTAGTVIRYWTAVDENPAHPEASCTSVLTVEHLGDWVVAFPVDTVIQCDQNGQGNDPGEPIIFFNECELIAFSYEDTYFYVVPNACYKINRDWIVINWCTYNPDNLDLYLEDGFSEIDLGVDWDGDGDQDERTFRAGYNNSGTPGIADGFITYQQEILVDPDGDPQIQLDLDTCIVGNSCMKDFVIPYPQIIDDCSTDHEVTVTGSFGVFEDLTTNIIIEDVGVGDYWLNYKVTDNCGGLTYEDYYFSIVDCKPPVAFCHTVFNVQIPSSLAVEIQAEELDLASFDNCSEDLIFSFSANISDQLLTLTCADIGQYEVQLWAMDEVGLQDSCVMEITVLNDMGYCINNPDTATILGNISTHADIPVKDVFIDVNGGADYSTTDINGLYSFYFPKGFDYILTPLLDVNPTNGVTTYDIVLISQHILDVNLLDSPYKIIAADANHSGTVSTLDIVEIRKVILFLENSFPNNTSWRFVDADYVFPNPLDPWQELFPEWRNYANLNEDDLLADFTAIKIGDVNHSVQ